MTVISSPLGSEIQRNDRVAGIGAAILRKDGRLGTNGGSSGANGGVRRAPSGSGSGGAGGKPKEMLKLPGVGSSHSRAAFAPLPSAPCGTKAGPEGRILVLVCDNLRVPHVARHSQQVEIAKVATIPIVIAELNGFFNESVENFLRICHGSNRQTPNDC